MWTLRGGLWCVDWRIVGGIIGSVVGCGFLERPIFALVEVVVFGIFVHLVSIYWDVLGGVVRQVVRADCIAPKDLRLAADQPDEMNMRQLGSLFPEMDQL